MPSLSIESAETIFVAKANPNVQKSADIFITVWKANTQIDYSQCQYSLFLFESILRVYIDY